MASLTTSATPPFVTFGDVLAVVPGIPPSRIRLVPTPGTATEADVIRVRNEERQLCELLDGVLVEKAMGTKESIIACRLIVALGVSVREHDLGLVVGEGGMLRLAQGLIRIPDVSFISWEQLPGRNLPEEPVWGMHPDLVIEVLSESNTTAEMERKIAEYFAFGTRAVWLVDPRTETVAVFAAPQAPQVFRTVARGEMLAGDPVLPGLEIDVAALFDG